MTETIRDRWGHIIGFIDGSGRSGLLVARDRLGHEVATYDERANETRLPNGHFVAYGNILAAFLVSDRRD